MKKRGIKNLKLNKNSVSTLNETTNVKGGGSALCTGLAGSCWCNVTVTDCRCPKN
jgi:hypothetical protein